ncbi:MAG: TlpA family protein disulfide reductase [Bacteroidetes bacterium]|nr:TlpA family protein disulfide reductase [Bacteroidota bacterium]
MSAFRLSLLAFFTLALVTACDKNSDQTVPGDNKTKMEYISGLGSPDLSPGTHPKSGQPVELNWELKTLAGEKVLLSDFKGKVIFLNLWATWCPPCKMELPSIEKLTEQGLDVKFLLVSNESADEVTSFFKPIDSRLPAFLAEGEYPSDFMTEGIPATYIIDKEGKLAAFHLGSAQWDDPSVIDFLKKLQ